MTKGNLEWEEFTWLTVSERINSVCPGREAWQQATGRRGSRRRKLRAHVFKCKHKAERTNQKQCEALNPKAYPQQYTSSCKVAPPKLPQTAPTNWKPSFKYKSLQRTSLLKLLQCLSLKFLFVASSYKPSLVFPKFILRLFDEIPKQLFS